jgi:hypothetical protein
MISWTAIIIGFLDNVVEGRGIPMTCGSYAQSLVHVLDNLLAALTQRLS